MQNSCKNRESWQEVKINPQKKSSAAFAPKNISEQLSVSDGSGQIELEEVLTVKDLWRRLRVRTHLQTQLATQKSSLGKKNNQNTNWNRRFLISV